ncbi:MAG: DegT/DnrJ/EryC1/StrS family aminotransferase [Armatimonadetes bacterium]|nr:DegT/DnrJ/EryC1/StrS family aminotransferase [Armatimonadota bacterium]
MSIPLIDLKLQYQQIRQEVQTAISGALDSMQLFLGPNVQRLEEDFANFCGVQHAIGVANGTEALSLSLRALEIGRGDEVITVSWTFIATLEAIVHVGATPVVVDIDPRTYCLDPAALARAITPRTRAVIPVHVFGHPADMDAIREVCGPRRIHIVEDACQAHGARYRKQRVGSLGDAAAFSFYMSKNLAGYGDGGMVTTNDSDVARRLRMLRDHGQEQRGVFSMVGYNSRLDELQAAILNVKMRRLAKWHEARRHLADYYNEKLSGLDLVTPHEAPGCEHVYHLYAIRSPRRDAIAAKLQEAGIGFAMHYKAPPHLQPALGNYNLAQLDLPVTLRCADEILQLPMYPELTTEQVDQVCEVVRSALG